MKLHCASYDKLFTFLNLHKILFIALDLTKISPQFTQPGFAFTLTMTKMRRELDSSSQAQIELRLYGPGT